MSTAATGDLRRKAAFLVCGAVGFALYVVASLLLVRHTALGPGSAAFVAVLLAVPPTFLLQKRVAFRHRGAMVSSFAKYCALQAANAVAIGVLAAVGRRLAVPDALNFVVSAAIVVVVSWLVLSGHVFRDGGPRRVGR